MPSGAAMIDSSRTDRAPSSLHSRTASTAEPPVASIGSSSRISRSDSSLGQLRVVDDGLQRLLVAVHAEEADAGHRDHRQDARPACRRRPAGSAPRPPSCRTPASPGAVSSGVVTSTALELQLARRLVGQHPGDLGRQLPEVAGRGGDVAQQRHLVADERVADLDDDAVRHRAESTGGRTARSGDRRTASRRRCRRSFATSGSRSSRSTSRHSDLPVASAAAGGVAACRGRGCGGCRAAARSACWPACRPCCRAAPRRRARR